MGKGAIAPVGVSRSVFKGRNRYGGFFIVFPRLILSPVTDMGGVSSEVFQVRGARATRLSRPRIACSGQDLGAAGYLTSEPVITRWISLAPSKIVKILEL
jgi:hypothetical protein